LFKWFEFSLKKIKISFLRFAKLVRTGSKHTPFENNAKKFKKKAS